ncbi:MAG: helix-turn-helix transcriptional regulator [Balneola sp.]
MGSKKIKISGEILSNIDKITVDISVELTPTLLDGIEHNIDFSIQELLLKKAQKIAKELEFILSKKEVLESLTSREIEILKLLASDKNNPEIAEILFISRRTVEEHRKNLNKKLNIKRPFQILRFASAFELHS